MRPRDVRLPAEGIDELASADGARHGVEREVAGREVVLDPGRERREVDGSPVLERDPPGPVALGERKRRAAARPRERPRGDLGLAARDVEVDDRAAEQLVAQGAADEPALPARERLAQPIGEVSHRRTRAWLARRATGCRS